MDKLNVKIAGEIALSEAPGGTMRKWREIFCITQAELGKFMGITASTISDYEGNRRKSPGIAIVRRFVDAVIEIDLAKEGAVVKRLREENKEEKFFELAEFSQALSGPDFAKLIEAKVVSGNEFIESKRVLGFTLMDSVKVILEMPYSEFPKLYGMSPERAFVFTGVTTGRSPMVVVRVSQVKPSIVVIHGIEKVDRLALKISQVEKIPLLLTKMTVEEMREKLKRV